VVDRPVVAQLFRVVDSLGAVAVGVEEKAA
jgi:hypothetical protein